VSISLDNPPNTCLVWPPFSALLAGLVGLLVIELLTLTVSFDTEVVIRHGGRWVALLGQTHHIPTIAVAVAMATVLLGGGRLRHELGRLTTPEHRPGQALALLVGHLAAFGGFTAVTVFVLGGDLGTSTYPGGWIAAWVALSLVSMAFWGAVALPMELWVPLLRRITAVLLTGVIVGLAAWAAGLLTIRAWGPLGQSTLWTVRGLLGLMGCDVVCDPAEFLIGTRTFQAVIAPACSGYEGIGLVWVFLGAYLWSFRRRLRFPQAWLLIPLGTAVIWLANAVRLTALVAVGTWISADIAAGGFHSQAGRLAFNAVALGLVLISQRARLFAKADPADDRQAVESPSVAALAPLLSIVARPNPRADLDQVRPTVKRTERKLSTREPHRGEKTTMMSTKTGRRKRLRDTLNFHRFALSTEAFERRQSVASDVFLQGMAFVDVNNNSVLDAGEWYLANATIKLFDSTGRPSSVERLPTPWGNTCLRTATARSSTTTWRRAPISTSRFRRRRRSARRIVHHKLWFIAHPLWGTD